MPGKQARRRLEASAARYLAAQGCDECRFVLNITSHEVNVTIKVRQWPRDDAPPALAGGANGDAGLPVGARWLSPLERKILETVDLEYRSSERIADLAGVKCSDGFKAILTNLADAGLLEPLSGKGYRLAQSGLG